MKPPDWRSEVSYIEFCNRLGYLCPKCKAWLRVDDNPLVARGSDVLMDSCNSCGIQIVIDNFTLPTTTVIEGYESPNDVQLRLMELAIRSKQKGTGPPRNEARTQKWWQFWR
jgi:hypothetical protein